jgi:hypothetical protein
MFSHELPIPRDPTEEEALALFKVVEELFPSKSLGDNKWYILTVSYIPYSDTRYLGADHASLPRW